MMNETTMESTVLADNDGRVNGEGTEEDTNVLGITPLNLRMLLMAERYKNLSALDADDDLDDQDPTTPVVTTPVVAKKPTTKWGKLSMAVVGNKSIRKNSTFKNNVESSRASSSSSKENFEMHAQHIQEGIDSAIAGINEEGDNGPMGESKQNGLETEIGMREGLANAFDEDDALEYWDQLMIPQPPPLPLIPQTLPAITPPLTSTDAPTTTVDDPLRNDNTASAKEPSLPTNNLLSLTNPNAIDNNNQAEGQGLAPETDIGAQASTVGVNDAPLVGVVSSERVVMVPAQTVETLTFVPPPPPTFESDFDMGSQQRTVVVSRVPESIVRQQRESMELAILEDQRKSTAELRAKESDVIWREHLARQRVVRMEDQVAETHPLSSVY